MRVYNFSQERSKAAPAAEPEKPKKPSTAANDPFEKYFAKSEAASSASRPAQTSSSTLPRYSRPY
jgi:hypothetical protein